MFFVSALFGNICKGPAVSHYLRPADRLEPVTSQREWWRFYAKYRRHCYLFFFRTTFRLPGFLHSLSTVQVQRASRRRKSFPTILRLTFNQYFPRIWSWAIVQDAGKIERVGDSLPRYLQKFNSLLGTAKLLCRYSFNFGIPPFCPYVPYIFNNLNCYYCQFYLELLFSVGEKFIGNEWRKVGWRGKRGPGKGSE